MRVMSPTWRPALGAALIAAVWFAGFAPGVHATVFTRFDFETPGYGSEPRKLTDHCLVKVAGSWHLFYTEMASAVATNHIGHAVSTDLVHWTDHPAALVPGAPAWMAHQVWAPQVLALPGGGWRM